MGLFTSYCKKCNMSITWFIKTNNGYINCKKCGEKNTDNDLILSMHDEEYWNRQKLINRILKINKIKNV